VSGRRHGGDDDESFAAALDDVVPLANRDKLRTPPAGAARANAAASATPTRFRVESEGERIQARAEDVSRKLLLRLRRGGFDMQREVDLHGLSAAAAERTLRAELLAARAAGLRCVRIIHGRGRHSVVSPVLRRAVPEWLQRPPLAAGIMAFCTAPSAQGGVGATLVLLRRERSRGLSSAP
jgi:DNA-nicking Smr family endonuclease